MRRASAKSVRIRYSVIWCWGTRSAATAFRITRCRVICILVDLTRSNALWQKVGRQCRTAGYEISYSRLLACHCRIMRRCPERNRLTGERYPVSQRCCACRSLH